MTIQDMSGQIQAYLTKNDLPEGVYESFKAWDLGDIVGLKGKLFKTKTGELTIHANETELLTKSLKPLPEKHAGLVDTEQRYRKRYLDLITNQDSREIFKQRSFLIKEIRSFFDGEGFMEVETPMMHSTLGGAAAKPFITHHNTLDLDLYLRIAPELYLKRLVVGGIEKVFEINRNFRNEGISTIHNPEFTMLEFYEAYGELGRTAKLIQKLVQDSVLAVNDSLNISYEDKPLNLKEDFKIVALKDLVKEKLGLPSLDTKDEIFSAAKDNKLKLHKSWGWGKVLLELFEAFVEKDLWEPTFVKDYPYEVSPLSRRKDDDDDYTDRMELFIAGREFSNFFCELNDPHDQEQRFTDQVEQKKAGDSEAMFFDDDYINALQHGMPPAVGVGIGIDRLIMLATDRRSIRDVVFFPTLK